MGSPFRLGRAAPEGTLVPPLGQFARLQNNPFSQ
jgi:hypothetical protein